MTESKPIFSGPNSFLDCMNHEYMIQQYPDEKIRKKACIFETTPKDKRAVQPIANIPTQLRSVRESN